MYIADGNEIHRIALQAVLHVYYRRKIDAPYRIAVTSSTTDGNAIRRIDLQWNPHSNFRRKFDTLYRIPTGSPCALVLPTKIRYSVPGIALHNPNPCLLLTAIRCTVSHCRGIADRNATSRIAWQGHCPQEMRYAVSDCDGFHMCISAGNRIRRIALQGNY